MEKNICQFCGEPSKYELCRECYQLSKEEIIIKNDKGKWIKNIRKGNEYKFYDEKKEYYLKQDILNDYEFIFYQIAKQVLPAKYTIIPQVNLQSIISTNSNKRNDELYRNVDFAVFYTNTFTPFLIIELNGQQHYTNEYNKERDKSIKQILDKVNLPLLTIDTKDLKIMSNNQVAKLIKKVINYLNPNIIQKLFLKKDYNKLDLSWTKKTRPQTT